MINYFVYRSSIFLFYEFYRVSYAFLLLYFEDFFFIDPIDYIAILIFSGNHNMASEKLPNNARQFRNEMVEISFCSIYRRNELVLFHKPPLVRFIREPRRNLRALLSLSRARTNDVGGTLMKRWVIIDIVPR